MPARRSVLLLVSLLAACGSRTGLRVGDGGAPGPCTEPPWILFSYIDYPVFGIYAMHADGTGLHELSLPSARPLDPALSADGRTLAYVDEDAMVDAGRIVLFDLVSHTARTVVSGTQLTYPTFSPDGAQLAFAEGLDVHLVQRDGSRDHVLVSGPFDIGCCSWGYGHPTYETPSTLIFTTAGLISAIGTDGSHRETILQSEFTTLPYPNPTLSPDGTRLASIIACTTSSTQLRIYPIASLPAPCTSGTLIVDGLSPDADVTNSPNPAWGPTDMIAFGQAHDVFVVPATGGTPQNLTSTLTAGGGGAGNPVWAPGCIELP